MAAASHQGLIAVVSAKPVMTLEALLDNVQKSSLVVVLDGVEDPRNLGAIIRTAEGGRRSCFPSGTARASETVSRSCRRPGHVKVARIGNAAQSPETLKARG